MPGDTVSRTITLRLPNELYERTSALAHQRHQCLNSLLQESLLHLLEVEENRRWSEGFAELARHPEECDVEYALPAQREVVHGRSDSAKTSSRETASI